MKKEEKKVSKGIFLIIGILIFAVIVIGIITNISNNNKANNLKDRINKLYGNTVNIEKETTNQYYEPFDENGFPKIIRKINQTEIGDNGQGYTLNITMSDFIEKYNELVKTEENKIKNIDLISENKGQRVYKLKINSVASLNVFVSSENYIVALEYDVVGRLTSDENTKYIYMAIFNTDETHAKVQIMAEEETGTTILYNNGIIIDRITNTYTETVRMTCNYPYIDNAIDVNKFYK